MTMQEKKLIEAIKFAEKISIRIEDGKDTVNIDFKKNKKLYHDIAIAYQTFLRDVERSRI